MDSEPPLPPRDPSSGSAPIADMRDEFARVSRGRDPDAERAFIESKLEMIRTDPSLSEEEKAAAMAEVEERLSGRSRPPDEPR